MKLYRVYVYERDNQWLASTNRNDPKLPWFRGMFQVVAVSRAAAMTEAIEMAKKEWTR